MKISEALERHRLSFRTQSLGIYTHLIKETSIWGYGAGLIGSFLKNGTISKDDVGSYISDLCKH